MKDYTKTKEDMENIERYNAAAHGMQTGVRYMLEHGSTEAASKHLRVGINSAMVTDKAIAELLVEKGIITTSEYFKKVADCMEEERDNYQELIEKEYGIKVTLR